MAKYSIEPIKVEYSSTKKEPDSFKKENYVIDENHNYSKSKNYEEDFKVKDFSLYSDRKEHVLIENRINISISNEKNHKVEKEKSSNLKENSFQNNSIYSKENNYYNVEKKINVINEALLSKNNEKDNYKYESNFNSYNNNSNKLNETENYNFNSNNFKTFETNYEIEKKQNNDYSKQKGKFFNKLLKIYLIN